MYSWSGLGTVPPSLVTFVDEITTMEDCGHEEDTGAHRDRRRNRNRRLGGGGGGGGRGGACGNESMGKNDPFGTKRDSLEMIDLWRQQMPPNDHKAVWNACRDSGVMAELRYSP